MTRIKSVVFLVVLFFLWTLSAGETEVSCVYMESCILPCSLQESSTDVVIHWFQVKTEQKSVHSYYFNQDQLGDQDQNFRGRTSLFKEQISRGNASLQLTGVKVQDEGRYRCNISTVTRERESYINLRVDAPVNEVNIRLEGNKIICSSDGIYPEPELSWSTNSTSNKTFKSTTIVQQNKEQLYNIISSLILSDSYSVLAIDCTVSTFKNRMTATFVNRFNRGIAIGMVVGVILITILTGLAPCIYLKYKKHASVLIQKCCQADTWTERSNSQDNIVFTAETDSHAASIDSTTTHSSGEINEV